MTQLSKFLFSILLMTLSASGFAKQSDAEEVEALLEWNKQILHAAEKEDGFLTLKGLRASAMAHIAMNDALASIDGRFPPVIVQAEHANAEFLPAIVQAAYTIALDQYPGEREVWDLIRTRFLGDLTNDESKDKSIKLGEEVAIRVLEYRQADNWNAEADYQWHPMAPGVYAEFNEHSGTPEGFIFGSGWAKAKPFVLRSSDQFRSPPPPDINTSEYRKAFDEVKSVGSETSKLRTQDQTHLALWWKDFVENSHNRLARKLVRERGLDAPRTARLFALLNIAIFDAYINVFDNKFHYNHWRPYTAIRWADNDGNPETKPDPSWNNTHKHTYAFPSYPSAHGTACSAAMAVIANTLGDDTPFSMVTAEVDRAGPFSGKLKMEPSERSFSSFSEAAEECSLSRVYLGIHFRYDSLEGNRLGKEIGEFIIREETDILK